MRRPVALGNVTTRCFGCGADSDGGLRLTFVETDDGVEAEYAVPSRFEGAPGVVHGGIQAVLLDEVLCVTAWAKGGTGVVTGELTVRYHRPVPSGTPLLVRGRIVEERGTSWFIEGTIARDGSDETLTTARGRFFKTGELGPTRPSAPASTDGSARRS